MTRSGSQPQTNQNQRFVMNEQLKSAFTLRLSWRHRIRTAPSVGRFGLGLAFAILNMMTPMSSSATSFADELAFLQKHIDVVVLSDPSGQAQVAIAPAYQGRVMTSGATGADGLSFGWINRNLIASGQLQPHINVFGGEDRFWIGPEGGQFSIFFAKGVPFDLAHWFTPAALDTEPFSVVRQDKNSVRFRHAFTLTNYSGTIFEVQAERDVRLLPPAEAWQKLRLPTETQVRMVAYESANKITNQGTSAWTRETGLLSIWILGMFNPSPATTIVLPIRPGPTSELGPRVKSDYFGPVPTERLVVKDNVVFFSGDGHYRSKIGLNPKRARSTFGSYDATHHALTLVQYTPSEGRTDYVNSMWEIQKNPFRGDVVNSYNDGPPAPGQKALGPFYELETSSPAAALAPHQSLEHVHRTFHLVGPKPALDAIAKATLGVGLDEITNALPSPK